MAVMKLAFFNVWRRLSRSILALIAMAIAAAVLTSGLSISRGVPSRAFGNYRSYFSGEIVVFTPGFIGAGPLQDSDAMIVRRQIVDSGFNQLLRFYPALDTGYYAEEHWQYRPLVRETISSLLSIEGIGGYTPHYIMPAQAGRGHDFSLRVIPSDQWPTSAGHTDGLPSDFDIVLNAYPVLRDEAGNPIEPGRIIDVAIPFFTLDNHGFPVIDPSRGTRVYNARVADVSRIPTRIISWNNPELGVLSEQGYVHASEIYMLEDTWQQLWSHHSGGVEYPILSMGLTVTNMAEINTITQALRGSNPQIAFLPIHEFVRHLDRYTLLDWFYRAPAVFWRGEQQVAHPMSQQDFGMITAGLLFLNAGMLLASQMLTAVAGRRNEIGILKAVGARQRDVVGMILMEAAILSLIGGSFGFFLIRTAALHQSITNQIPMFRILATTLRELGFVLGITLLASLVFGVLPAWKVSRLTVMEVFRNE